MQRTREGVLFVPTLPQANSAVAPDQVFLFPLPSLVTPNIPQRNELFPWFLCGFFLLELRRTLTGLLADFAKQILVAFNGQPDSPFFSFPFLLFALLDGNTGPCAPLFVVGVSHTALRILPNDNPLLEARSTVLPELKVSWRCDGHFPFPFYRLFKENGTLDGDCPWPGKALLVTTQNQNQSPQPDKAVSVFP